MSDPAKKLLQTLGRISVATILLVWILHSIFLNEAANHAHAQGHPWEDLTRLDRWRLAWQHGPEALWKTLTLIPIGPLLVSIALMGITLLLGVIRWRMVLRAQGLDLGSGRALEISFVAHFFNSFLLGSTGGDLMKAYYAARQTRHQKTEAVVTVLIDRVMGLWAMLLFAGVMMLPNLELLHRHEGLRTLAFLMLFMLALCTGLVVLAFYGGVSRGWSGARAWMRRLPKGPWLERSLDSCRTFGRTPGFIPRVLGISMILNAVCVAQVMVLSRGLQQTIPSLALFVMVPMIICVSAIPITPSGLGVRENLFVFLLTDLSLNVEATSALSLSLLAYAGSLFWSLVGGLVYVTLKERHHLRDPGLATQAHDS